MADGLRSGRTAARIVADRTIEQLERVLAIPIEQAIVPAMAQVASDADRERVRERRARGRLPGGPPLPRGAPAGRTYAATREQPGLVSAPDGDTLYRHAIRRWTSLDMEPADVHQVGPRRARVDQRRAARPSPRAEGFGDDLARLPAQARDRPREPGRRRRRRSSRAATRTSCGPARSRRASSAASRGPRCEVRPVEAFKEKDAPFAYYFPPTLDGVAPRHLLRQHLRPAEPDVLEARLDDVPRGHPGPPLPDQPRDGAPGAQRVPPARRPHAAARRLRRGLGPVRASAWPTSSGCTGRRPSGSGCSTRRRGARRG